MREWMLFMRWLRFALFCCLCLLALVGCHANSTIKHSEKASAFSKKITLNGDIVQVKVADSVGFEHNHDHYFMTIHEGLALENFITVLTKAKLNSEEQSDQYPSYDLLLKFSNKEELKLHLLLGKPGEPSAFIFNDDIDKLYWVDDEETEILIDIFQVKKPQQMKLN